MLSKNSMVLLSSVRVTTAFFQRLGIAFVAALAAHVAANMEGVHLADLNAEELFHSALAMSILVAVFAHFKGVLLHG